MSRLFGLVLAQLVIGGVSLLLLVPLRTLGRRFFQTCTWIFLGMLLFSYWLQPPPEGYTRLGSLFSQSLWATWEGREFGGLSLYLLLVFLHLVSLYAWRDWLVRGLLGLSVVCGAFVLFSSSAVFRTVDMSSLQAGLLPVNFFLSALALGTVFTGMLFGHWYLVDPSLPLRLIHRFSWLLVAVLVAQGVALIAFVVFGFEPRHFAAVWGEGALFSSWGVFFWGRALFGLLGTLLVALVIFYSLRIHATRTATGFFYIAILTVFTGELMGRFILFLAAVPV